MKKLNIKLMVLLALMALATQSFAQIRVAPLNFKKRMLANGMKVISLPDNSTPQVAVTVWYRVGSKDDPDGRSGFAHMFEHMMFKSTKNMKSEMFDRLTEDVGGWNNASTWDDFTNYYQVVPSNYLETLLWAESDRMVNLNVDNANFTSERDVVKEEFRQRILANPYGMLFGQYVEKLSFTAHPYKRPGIGNLDELNAATPSDANEFYQTFYRPDNAVLIVVGDFDQKQLEAWVDKYFGRIPKPNGTIPRVTIVEPNRTEEKRFTEYAPNVPLPAVAITYLAPAAKSKDIAALQIASTIMSGGESSRLYQQLVYSQSIAQNAWSELDTRADVSLFKLMAILAGDKKPEEAEKGLLTELKKMQTTLVSAKELAKAKNQLITNTLSERETVDGKAMALGIAEMWTGAAANANKSIAELQAVTARDVQRVMKQYFNDKNRVVIYYLNEKEKK
jgi:zinc protease